MPLLKLAVIGTGALGRHHSRILSTMEGVQLVGIADVNEVAGRAVAENCRTRWTDDYRTLLADVDAVVVAVPTFAHRDVAGECLERRIPVLVEKPIASNLRQARELVERADARGVLLQVGHVERHNPAWLAAVPYVDQPRYIRSERFSPYSFRSTDIGVVHDVLIHDIDLSLAVAGSPLVRCEAVGASIVGGHEDCVQTRLTFASGCVADLCANRVSPVARRSMQIWSQAGCTSIDFASREVLHYARSETLMYGSSLPERAKQPGANIEQMKNDVFGTYIRVKRPTVATADALTDELREFTTCVRTGARPAVSGREAIAAMEVADQILQHIAAEALPAAMRKAG